MATNQEQLQAAVRTAASVTVGTYNENWADLAADGGFTGTFNERLAKWLQAEMSSTNPSLPGLKAEFAASLSRARWGDLTAIE